MQNPNLGLVVLLFGGLTACAQQSDESFGVFLASNGGTSTVANINVGADNSSKVSGIGRGGSNDRSGSTDVDGGGGNSSIKGVAGNWSPNTEGRGSTSGGSTGTANATGVHNECAQISGESKSATAPPVIEFLLDNTDSMSDSTQPSTHGKSKWRALQDAFNNAIPTLASQHPEYAVGLTYFHYKGYGRSGVPCTDALQAVEIAPLTSSQANTIVKNVEVERQIANTPTQDIWQFGADHVLKWDGGTTYANSNRYVVVLTDGVPTVAANCGDAGGCGGLLGGLGMSITVAQYQEFISAVGGYLNGNNVVTFMIAIPGAEALNQVTCLGGSPLYEPISKMSDVAKAGGTDLIDLTTSTTTDFTTALVDAITQRIGGQVASVVSCDYAVPEPPTDSSGNIQFVDPKQVAVWYYESGGSDCARDSDCRSGHCSPSAAANPNKCYTLVPGSEGCVEPNGWDYADATKKSIKLCSSSCSTAQTDADAKIEIMIGCFEVG